ncbi:hypothetical protein FV219_10010 [Methylobacterium sp. WL122]|nr:hypothetical protein FV219_10010 [Methylobacterium sp. WL122]
MIRWSVQEIRCIAVRLAQRRIQPAHVIAWSLWRRAHRAGGHRAHLKPQTATTRPEAQESHPTDITQQNATVMLVGAQCGTAPRIGDGADVNIGAI